MSHNEELLEAGETDDTMRARTTARVTADPARYVTRYLNAYSPTLNADNASELFPEYAASAETRATRGPAVRQAAAIVMERAFERLLAQPVPTGRKRIALFTSGGNASGKSSTIDPDGSHALAWDTTASSLEPTAARIDQALEAGLEVHLAHLSVAPEEAFRRAIVRSGNEGQGRTVTIAGVAQTHEGSRKTALALGERYAGDPRVQITVFENTPTGLARRDLDWLRSRDYRRGNELRTALRDILERAHAGGAVSDAVYRGFLGVEPIRDGRGSRNDSAGERADLPRPDSGRRAQAESSRGDAPS